MKGGGDLYQGEATTFSFLQEMKWGCSIISDEYAVSRLVTGHGQLNGKWARMDLVCEV